GPVDILVNNATGWVQDPFGASDTDLLGRSQRPVTAETFTQQLAVDAMASALLISELARRLRCVVITGEGCVTEEDEPGAAGQLAAQDRAGQAPPPHRHHHPPATPAPWNPCTFAVGVPHIWHGTGTYRVRARR
ncbi:MAG TPA: hypothetical protein VGO89_05285, partial [Streptomyces sp.]|nr:hypothetical protein [Streptomyces sp.]